MRQCVDYDDRIHLNVLDDECPIVKCINVWDNTYFWNQCLLDRRYWTPTFGHARGGNCPYCFNYGTIGTCCHQCNYVLPHVRFIMLETNMHIDPMRLCRLLERDKPNIDEDGHVIGSPYPAHCIPPGQCDVLHLHMCIRHHSKSGTCTSRIRMVLSCTLLACRHNNRCMGTLVHL